MAPKKSSNRFAVIEDMDGNPATALEFDYMMGKTEEFFFVPAEGATEDDKNRCIALNYIHKVLHADMARVIPAKANDDPHLEVVHVEEFQGRQIKVCVQFTEVADGEKPTCFGIIKVVGKEYGADGAVVEYDTEDGPHADGSPNTKHWVPRFRYIACSLRKRMLVDFDRNGREIYREPEPAAEETQVAATSGKSGSGGDIEEELTVFSGCKGKIIGPQGSVIKEIRASTGVTDIVLPPKPEEGEPRPRARDLVSITLKGSQAAVEMAKKKIMDIQDAWANAPRPSRDGGSYGNGGSNSNETGGPGAWGEATSSGDFGGAAVTADGGWEQGSGGEIAASGGWENGGGNTNGGGDNSWAAEASGGGW